MIPYLCDMVYYYVVLYDKYMLSKPCDCREHVNQVLSKEELELILQGIHYPAFDHANHGLLRTKIEQGNILVTLCLTYIYHFLFLLSLFLVSFKNVEQILWYKCVWELLVHFLSSGCGKIHVVPCVFICVLFADSKTNQTGVFYSSINVW